MCKMSRNICELLKQKKTPCLEGSETTDKAVMAMDNAETDIIGVSCDGDFVGVFRRKDYFRNVVRRNLNPKETSLYEVMIITPPSIPTSYNFKEAYETMLSYQWNYMPVVREKKLYGIVTMDELGHDIIEAYQEAHNENEIIINYIQGGESYGSADYTNKQD